MKPTGALACVLSLGFITTGHACDITYDPKPTWEQMIDEVDVLFLGEVVAIMPGPTDIGPLAAFRVDRNLKGGVGPRVKAVTEASSCTHGFEIGDRVIFAGDVYGTEEDTYEARDSGWDPTVVLSDPPTPEQMAQLDYVNKLADEQSTKGATK